MEQFECSAIVVLQVELAGLFAHHWWQAVELVVVLTVAFVMGNFLMYGIKTTSRTAWQPSQDGSAEERKP